MQSMNLTYEWNDVALLTDQRAYTFICKTMLQIPENEVEALQEIILVDWKYRPIQKNTLDFDGQMQLQIGYLNQEKQRKELQVTVPLQAELQEELPENASARLIYNRGKVAGNCLLLETVLQVPRFQALQRSQVILGQFQMEELLELPEEWPYCQDLLATVAAVQVNDYQIEQQQLKLTGEYQLAVIYENVEQPGECLFAYEQRRDMNVTVAVPPGLQELEQLLPYYQNLTAQQLDDRHVLLAGDGVLCTSASCRGEEKRPLQVEQTRLEAPAQISTEKQTADQPFDEALTQRMGIILQQLMEELKRHQETEQGQQQQDTETKKTPPMPEQKVAKQTCDTVCPTREVSNENRTEHPSVVNYRGSRRANLSKYMRNLNSSVRGPKSMRNFEIGSEYVQEQTEAIEEQEDHISE